MVPARRPKTSKEEDEEESRGKGATWNADLQSTPTGPESSPGLGLWSLRAFHQIERNLNSRSSFVWLAVTDKAAAPGDQYVSRQEGAAGAQLLH